MFYIYIDIFNFIFEKNLEANSRVDIELHFFKDVLMQHDTAVITYTSHFGNNEKYGILRKCLMRAYRGI